ncbi:hypothetical protein [Stenotrophomonas acidaminiphila]|uniref:hypothetical protein n=1 Tax=Stenotrophomonas acidaminiphila TaxID=128780 RepID=UPI001FAFE897|nr:hypothetical protein [Stenotrophomonas acidaminiphila]
MANTTNRPKQLAMLLALLFLLAWALPAAAADVWVNTGTGVYHCPGGQYYDATKRGRFMSEREAAQHGYRAAYGRTCSPGEAEAGRQQVIQQLTQSATRTAPTATRVWINTGSHVYHCPGTRYFGATRQGRYATEAEAVASGNRPAYGARCK